MGYLNNKVLHDRPLRIVLSKHQQVQLPKDGQEAANLTKDFTNHSLHRYKKPNSKNFQVCFTEKMIQSSLIDVNDLK